MTQHYGKQEGHAWEHQEDQAWAHWDYTPDEWATLDQLDWRATVQRYLLLSALEILGCLVALLLWLWGITTPAANVVGFLLPVIVVLFISLFYLLPITAFRRARKRHKARLNPSQPQRVTLSGKGMWQAGTFFPFEGFGVETREFRVKLLQVRLTAQPATLHFRVEHTLTSNKYSTRLSYRSTKETIHLLVPHAHEGEAEQVAQRFLTEVIEARELARQRLHDSIVNPPEPS